ncbi:MAG: GAF domain-containing protein, partial [Anaerolineae bacterium]|nr:GAF domain-containing protein [Anaerolineae bacterium]
PLNSANRTLGAMIVASYTPGIIFTDDQLKVLWAIADQAATALDKARLFNETRQRALQLQTLNEISKELSSTLDLENLLNRIMKSAVEILGAEAGSLFLIDENTSELVFRVVEGGAPDLVGQRLPPGAGIVGEAAATGEPVIVDDVNKDRRWFSDIADRSKFRTESLLAVPLRIQDRSIGVVEVINKRDGSPFGAEEVALLTTFAAQAAVAIENARLYEATDAALAARVDELQNLQRIDRELNRTLNFDRVVNITLDWALRTTGASAGGIYMLSNAEDGLTIASAVGYQQAFLDEYRESLIPLELGLFGRVMRSGKPELVRQAQADPDYVQVTPVPSVAQIAVPILRANRPIGELVIESSIEGLLSDADLDFVQRLVEHAAVAIENARLLERIEQANRDKTEFISFVAHELKNPMTSIRGYTDLIKGGGVGPITDMQVNFLGTIRSNVDRMSRLVSDLSDVARLETNQMRLEMSPIAVREVIDETIRGMQALIDEKKQTLQIIIPGDLPPILADHTRMVQVMTNLVSNATKYTPEEGKIVVGARLQNVRDEATGETHPMVLHYVTDTGIGMSPEDLQKLFTKFFRTDSGRNMAQGTGLGLNITRSLIERHGGRIWVESEVGAGTTFSYLIPIADLRAEYPKAAD